VAAEHLTVVLVKTAVPEAAPLHKVQEMKALADLV
jgi:hypothetical protein